MPIYEYECKKCSKQFETLLLPGDQKPACPECGSRDLRKLVSRFVGRAKWQFDMETCKRYMPKCAPDLCRAGICPPELREERK